ncbi:unnamed protein product, partial [marine sediment metagenome]
MINMGIIGMGRMGEIHANEIKKNKNLNLIAVSKRNKDRIREIEKKFNIKVYLDNDGILNNKEINYIVIATTNETHEELTIKALNKGKNVIVEKPMALNHKGTQRMIKAAEKNKKNLFVYHSMLWDRDFLFVKDIVNSNKLGEILVINNSYCYFGEYWAGWGIHGMKEPWRIKSKYGGGMLMDMGPHLVSQILDIVNDNPIGVFGIIRSGLWTSEVDDHF